MPVSTYDMSVPMVTRGLNNLKAFLKKGEQWAEEKGMDKEKLLHAKLADDMKDLIFQIQTCCNVSKFIPVRVGGLENVSVEDNETTFDQLYQRIDKTVEFVGKAKPEDFKGKEDAEVVMKVGGGEIKFTGLQYLQNFAMPNFFFHETTAYAILRKEGVPVGKWDFLGKEL